MRKLLNTGTAALLISAAAMSVWPSVSEGQDITVTTSKAVYELNEQGATASGSSATPAAPLSACCDAQGAPGTWGIAAGQPAGWNWSDAASGSASTGATLNTSGTGRHSAKVDAEYGFVCSASGATETVPVSGSGDYEVHGQEINGPGTVDVGESADFSLIEDGVDATSSANWSAEGGPYANGSSFTWDTAGTYSVTAVGGYGTTSTSVTVRDDARSVTIAGPTTCYPSDTPDYTISTDPAGYTGNVEWTLRGPGASVTSESLPADGTFSPTLIEGDYTLSARLDSGENDSISIQVYSSNTDLTADKSVVLIGDSITFTATPPENYQGNYAWSGDGVTATTTSSPTFSTAWNSTGEKTVTVTFPDVPGASADTEVIVISLSVEEVGFKNDHPMKKWPSKEDIDLPDGFSPTWKKTGNPNLPAAYSKNTPPTIFAKIKVDPSPPSGVEAAITIYDGAEQIATIDNVTLGQSTLNLTGIDLAALGSKVETVQKTLTWKISIEGAVEQEFGSSGPHTLHVTDATPSVVNLFDRALEKACAYVDGDSAIASKINTGITSDGVIYDPAKASPVLYYAGLGNILEVYDEKKAQCEAMSFLMKFLLESIGVDGAEVIYYWGAAEEAEGTYYLTIALAPVSFRVGRPSSPKFTFHSIIDYAGTIYDPSYAVTGLPPFDQFAPADIDISPLGGYWPGAEDEDWDDDNSKEPDGTLRTGFRVKWKADAIFNFNLYLTLNHGP